MSFLNLLLFSNIGFILIFKAEIIISKNQDKLLILLKIYRFEKALIYISK